MARRPKSTIQGGLIGIEPDGILGWARDAEHPDAPVQVRLMAGSQVIGQATADRFDDPRVRTLVGAGVAGFLARLTVAPSGAYPMLLSVHDAQGGLLGSAMPLRGAGDLAALVGLPPSLTFEGNIDGIYAGALKGWARDAAAPDREMEVELLDTGKPAGNAIANLLREDLRQAGLHHGLYGFSFDLPVTLLDGHTHSLAVRIAGTQAHLRGGPVAFGPLATSALISQVSTLQSEVTALRRLVDGLVAADGPLQRQIMRTLAERVGAHAEIQREQLERDMAALRIMVFAAGNSGDQTEQYGAPGRP